MEPDRLVGVLGGRSLTGESILPLLLAGGWRVQAFSRSGAASVSSDVHWQAWPAPIPPPVSKEIHHWISLLPLWVLPSFFPLMEQCGIRRLVALSSTSRFTKDDSDDAEERQVARCLRDAEEQVQAWAQRHGVEWVILRPTLIYGFGQDKNISEIARFIRRFGFFPLFGKANGLRQPIHAADVAGACLAALQASGAANRAYNIAGGEKLTYRDMVARVFAALGRRPRLLTVPLWAFRLAVTTLRCLPRYRQWSVAMAERMNSDLVFDHADAVRDLGFKPRTFSISPEDIAR